MRRNSFMQGTATAFWISRVLMNASTLNRSRKCLLIGDGVVMQDQNHPGCHDGLSA